MTTPSLTRDYLVALFEEFRDVPVAKVNAFISIANVRVSPAVFQEMTQYAAALLTAHMLKTVGDQGGATGGPIVSETVGSLSRGYGTVGEAGADESYKTTRFGAEYIAIRDTKVIPGRVTGQAMGFGVRGEPDYSNGWGGGWNGSNN